MNRPQRSRPPDATLNTARDPFRAAFGFTPTVALRAPRQRILLGDPSQNGLVLGVATDPELTVAASPRSDGRIELATPSTRAPITLSTSRLDAPGLPSELEPARQVLSLLRDRGVLLRGFRAAFHYSEPTARPADDPAAVAVATAILYRELYPYTLTETGSSMPPARDAKGSLPPPRPAERHNIADLCHRALCKAGGTINHAMISLCGREDHAIEWDAQSGAVELAPVLGQAVLVVAATGIPGDRGNAPHDMGVEVAHRLNVPTLRVLELKQLEQGQGKLSEIQLAYARHVVEENRRVMYATRALQQGDADQLGQYLLQRHHSWRGILGEAHPVLDTLVVLARELECCHGACACPDGSTLNLVHPDHVEAFMERLATRFAEETGNTIEPCRCRIVDGAGFLGG